jgi:hypothetical protein
MMVVTGWRIMTTRVETMMPNLVIGRRSRWRNGGPKMDMRQSDTTRMSNLGQPMHPTSKRATTLRPRAVL